MAENNDKIICSNCKNELPQDSEFCQYCGSKISAERVDTVVLQSQIKTIESTEKNDISTKIVSEVVLEGNRAIDAKEQPLITGYNATSLKNTHTNSILEHKNENHNENQNVDFVLKQAFINLKVKAWKKAIALFDSIIVQSPYCARAYIGKLMAELKFCDEEDLIYSPKSLTEDYSFNMALEVADNDYKNKLLQIAKSRELNYNTFHQKADKRSFVSKMIIFALSLFGLFCEVALLSISFDETTGSPTLLLGVAVVSLITLICWIIYVLCYYGKKPKTFVFFPTLLTSLSYPFFILNSVTSNISIGTYVEEGKMLHNYFPRNIFPLQAVAGIIILITAVLFVISKGNTALEHKLLVLTAIITTVFSYNLEMFSNFDIFLINGIFVIPLVILFIYVFACSNAYISFPSPRIIGKKEKYLQSTYDWAVKEANENNLQSVSLAIRLFSTILPHGNSNDSLAHCHQKYERIEQKLKINKNKRVFLNSIIAISVGMVTIFATFVIPWLNADTQYNNQNYASAYYSYNYTFTPYNNEKFMESSYQYAIELFENKEYEAVEKVLANIPTSYKETEKYNYYITAMQHLNSPLYLADQNPCRAYEYIDYCIRNYDGLGDSEELMKSNYYLSSIDKMQGEWYFVGEEDSATTSAYDKYLFRKNHSDYKTKILKIVGSKLDGKQIVCRTAMSKTFFAGGVSIEFNGEDTIIVGGVYRFKKR